MNLNAINEKLQYRGRIAQVRIYLGKNLRMFIHQNDWKVLPMSALIAGLVTFAIGANLFVTQEGTLMGCFALTCVCIWNGFFNSIQSVCRERGVVKREHRAGMYISSYICAQMIYQCMLCVAQTAILLGVCSMAGVHFPAKGLVFGSFMPDMAVTMFLTTYSADMMSLAISCLVRNTTTAMTVMPFMLIFQLVFSGAFISLSGSAVQFTKFTIAKWGLRSMCTLGDYNSQPMVTLWNTVWKFRTMEIEGYRPIEIITNRILEEGGLNSFLLESGAYNTNPEYFFSLDNILHCWQSLVIIALISAILAGIILSFIDKDKR